MELSTPVRARFVRYEHIHVGVASPEFPTVDSSVFLPFVKSTYVGGSYLENVRIPAGTNPTISGGTFNANPVTMAAGLAVLPRQNTN